MIDMTQTIQPRSDQTNADDLISGPTTIKITAVTLTNSEQQPVNIEYEGGEGRPWKPCKTMRRVLVLAWGPDGSAYVGRSVSLFRDPKVKYAGAEQGGIRISHMSHIKEKIRMMLTVTRGKRSPFTVEPLHLTPGNPLSQEAFDGWKKEIDDAKTMAEISLIAGRIKEQNYEDSGRDAILKHYRAAVAKIRQNEQK